MILELTAEEANQLITLLDEAVKAKGLIAAEAGVYYFKKIKQAHEADQKAAVEEIKAVKKEE